MTTSDFDVMAELGAAGAVLLDRHFIYSSQKHGSGYINMDPLFTNTALMAEVGRSLWGPFCGDEVFTLAGPATGGIALVYAAAFTHLHDEGIPLAVVWADKTGEENEDFEFSRAGFPEQITGKKVLIVEDLLTTGKSVRKVAEQVILLGGEVIGVSAVCNRGGVTPEDMGVPRLESIAHADFAAIAPEDCPLCRDNVPIVANIGHAEKFRAAHPDCSGGYINLLSS